MSATLATSRLGRREFEIIATLLHTRSGLALGENKLYLLESRLAPVLQRHRLPDLAALAARLLGRDAEPVASEIVQAMTTNETFFFRDEKPFTHFRNVMLPALHAARPPGQKLRIWSAAASAGQEAYSLAMILADSKPLLGNRPFEVLGTDIAREPLARAREGLYSHFEVQRGLPVQMLVRYFKRDGESWRLSRDIREVADFREWNLLQNPASLGRFDVVFCRNVLIYFDARTKAGVLQGIGGQLAPDGALYLGGAETIVGIETPFEGRAGEVAYRLAVKRALVTAT